ncbi:MAG: response regulator [Candidatus Competibacteraceae bacterium]
MPVKHVLVVDDSKSARLMLRKMLQAFDLAVDMVESAEGALEYLRNRQPDAIFMDHTMPGIDGLEALRRIKNDPNTARIPIAMYTSKDEPAYQFEAQAAGAVGVLIKPAMPETLGALLKKMNAALEASAVSTATVSPSPSAGVSLEAVEKIAVEKAESVFYEAVESQVLPLMNDVVGKLRQELQTSMEGAIDRIATRICEARLTELRQEGRDEQAIVSAAIREQVPSLLDERLTAFRRSWQDGVEILIQEIAGKIYQNRLNELSERLVRQLSTRFVEATHKSGEMAREIAAQVAREAAVGAAREELATVHDTVERQAGEVAGRGVREAGLVAVQVIMRRIYLAAGLAATVGIGAALVVYGLR